MLSLSKSRDCAPVTRSTDSMVHVCESVSCRPCHTSVPVTGSTEKSRANGGRLGTTVRTSVESGSIATTSAPEGPTRYTRISPP